MTEAPENIVLAYLRRIDEKVDHLIEDVNDLKRRVTALEQQVADLHHGIANLHGDFAGQSARSIASTHGLSASSAAWS